MFTTQFNYKYKNYFTLRFQLLQVTWGYEYRHVAHPYDACTSIVFNTIPS